MSSVASPAPRLAAIPQGVAPVPHFTWSDKGQLHYWKAGSGPLLLVLPGLFKASAGRAAEVAAAFPSRTVACLDAPGFGGSPVAAGDAQTQTVEALEGLIGSLHGAVDLLAFDMQGPVAEELLRRCGNIRRAAWVGSERWEHRARQRGLCPSLDLKWDGTHLVRLWNHIRDLDILEGGDPRVIRTSAEPYISAGELDDALLCFGVNPPVYERFWNESLDAAAPALDGFQRCRSVQECAAAFEGDGATMATDLPRPPMTPSSIRDYVDVSRGRVHLRRAGRGKRLLLALTAGPGSSINLQPLVDRMGDEYLVVTPDYIGQGNSPRNTAPTDMVELGRDAAEIVRALGYDSCCVYGTHTGASVGLEMAIAYPDLVERLILDGLVMTPPGERPEAERTQTGYAYFPDLDVDRWGSHLLRTWNIRRDGCYFYPWFKPVQQYALSWAVPGLPYIHDRAICTLRSRTTPAYKAAICDYDAAPRLPLLDTATIIVAGPNDAFIGDLEIARSLAPDKVRFVNIPATIYHSAPENELEETAGILKSFLRNG